MDLIFFYFTANQLETSYFPNRYGDFLYLLFFVIFGNLLIVVPFSFGTYVIIRKAVVLSLTYLFCRKYPNSTITVFFIIKMKAMYFIWFQLLMAILEDRIIYSLSALIVGHAFYFMKEVLPVTKRIYLLDTPHIINKLAEYLLDLFNEKREPVRQANAQPNRFNNVNDD